MHSECAEFVASTVQGWRYWPRSAAVIEFGGLDVNGNVRLAVPHTSWYCVDIRGGPGVDEVADAATWQAPYSYDVGLCLEVFEHTAKWPDILENLAKSVRKGGLAIVTAACDPREPHGAYGDHGVPEGEYYANVDPVELDKHLSYYFRWFEMSVLGRGDVRAVAVK